jgi:hypothetical protein
LERHRGAGEYQAGLNTVICQMLKRQLLLTILILCGNPSFALNVSYPFDTSANFEELVTAFKTNVRTAKQHLEEHRQDTAACIKSFEILKNDPLTVERLYNGSTTEFPTVKSIFSKSKYAMHPSIVRLTQNSSRFFIGLDFHTKGVANIDAVQCNPLTDARLFLMEKLPASPEAWLLRREKMDSMVASLYYPWNENPSGLYDFDVLVEYLSETKSIYYRRFGRAYSAWLPKAASRIAQGIESAPSQVKRLDEWPQQALQVTGWARRISELARD